MKKLVMGFIAGVMTFGAFAEEPDEYAEELRPWYAGASAAMVLPQKGKMPRRSGAELRAGYYLNDFWALEASAAWMEDRAGLGFDVLWHWWGYERLDPFFKFGGRGWISGDTGPAGGVGTFYHLSDNWSLRLDADATLGLDGTPGMLYTLGLGVQYNF